MGLESKQSGAGGRCFKQLLNRYGNAHPIGTVLIKSNSLPNETCLCVSNVYTGEVFPKAIVKALRSPVIKKPMSLYLIQGFSYIFDRKPLLANIY